MKQKLILALSFCFFFEAQGVTRFSKEQLQFSLFESDGSVQTCSHKPLKNNSPAPPPPWWTVKCGDRSYVVDLWMDVFKKQKSVAIDLMYHAKEGTKSSGEKRVRFDTHLTRFEFDEMILPGRMSSNIDIRNGLADLRVQIKLK